MRPLFETLEAVTVGTSQHCGDLNLTRLIARSDMPTCPTYKSLDEAFSEGTIVISELSEAGSVPNLCAENSGHDPVLILDGEELVGAKQNRIANVTMLLPAHTKTTIPVSCVEARRWSYRRRHFSSAGHTYFLSGRASKAASVSARVTGFAICSGLLFIGHPLRCPVACSGHANQSTSGHVARWQYPTILVKTGGGFAVARGSGRRG